MRNFKVTADPNLAVIFLKQICVQWEFPNSLDPFTNSSWNLHKTFQRESHFWKLAPSSSWLILLVNSQGLRSGTIPWFHYPHFNYPFSRGWGLVKFHGYAIAGGRYRVFSCEGGPWEALRSQRLQQPWCSLDVVSAIEDQAHQVFMVP